MPDELVFFLNLPATEASLLLEVLSCCSTGIYVGDGNRYERCADAGVDLPMFERSADDGFFSDAKTPRGLRTLQHFFAYPAAFRFFRVKGLRERLRRAEGKAADIVIFCPDEVWQVEHFASKASNSPFLGAQLCGKVRCTICDGKVVYRA